jgi:hemerythrin HHE cation binding domain-containing protein
MERDFNSKSIMKILVEDHKYINSLVQKFMNFQENFYSQDKNLFQKIKWALDKHFYLEEKILFNFCNLSDIFTKELAKELIKQHDKILAIIKNLGEIIEDEAISLTDLIESQNDHVKYEMENYYKKIEELLDEDQRAQLISTLEQKDKLGFYPLAKLREYGLAKMKTKCGPVSEE